MTAGREPQPLEAALSEVIALRGLARVRGGSALANAWAEVAREWGKHTAVIGLRRGVLHVAVSNAPLRSELEGFHKQALLKALQENNPRLFVRDLKFQLKGNLAK